MAHSNKSAEPETGPVFQAVEDLKMWNKDSTERLQNIFSVICFELALILSEVKQQGL